MRLLVEHVLVELESALLLLLRVESRAASCRSSVDLVPGRRNCRNCLGYRVRQICADIERAG